MAYLTELEWIFVVGTIVAVAVAWGIGANDVANSFGSSVGSRALSMGQAIIVASLCEFLGAVLLGSNVAGTIKSGIAKLSAFQATPEIFMIGMLAVLIAVAFWLALATFLELPVSTSHSVVGAVVGMTIAIRGGTAVIWYVHKPGVFPYIGGMTVIFLSWIVSPVLAGIATSIIYLSVRHLVLRRKRSFDLACVAIVFLIGLTFFIIVVFIIQTGAGNDQWKSFDDSKTIWIGVVAGVAVAILVGCTLIPYARYTVHAKQRKLEQERADELDSKPDGDVELEEGKPKLDAKEITDVSMPGPASRFFSGIANKWRGLSFPGKGGIDSVFSVLTFNMRQKPHEVIQKDPFIQAMHDNAEKFDPATEALFRYLQVFTAATFSLAHGSNDVANSIGPYAAIYNIWQSGALNKNADVPVWILVVGGAGIVLGVSTFSYKIIRVLGVKMVHLSFTRGFSVELGAAIVVIVASRYGLPVSSTQVLTGSIIAIGLLEGNGTKSLNTKLLFKIVVGWIATLVVAAITAGIIAALFVYSPSKLAADDRVFAERQLNQETMTMLNELRAANTPLVTPAQLQAFTAQLATYMRQRFTDLRDVVNLNTNVFQIFNQVF